MKWFWDRFTHIFKKSDPIADEIDRLTKAAKTQQPRPMKRPEEIIFYQKLVKSTEK